MFEINMKNGKRKLLVSHRHCGLLFEFSDLEFQFKVETGKDSGSAARVAKPSPQGHNAAVLFVPQGRKTKTSGNPGEEYFAREDRNWLDYSP